ncbi:hypothetical protein [Streptomyces sp.]|uniref:hypothetical protein n=1 Tax=Streptomyces sp. TaxID=1931 RepID=UPI002F419257
MIVHSFDREGETALFDPETGRLSAVAPGTRPDPGAPVLGHFGALAGRLVVLCRAGKTLRLRVGDTDVPVGPGFLVRHRRTGDVCELSVVDEATNRSVVDVRYPAPADLAGGEFDPTPFADDEDFDLGLFVANVAGDPDRRNIIYT